MLSSRYYSTWKQLAVICDSFNVLTATNVWNVSQANRHTSTRGRISTKKFFRASTIFIGAAWCCIDSIPFRYYNRLNAILIRTVYKIGAKPAILLAAEARRWKTSWSYVAECRRGITDRLAGEFRDWTMSLESTDIERSHVARIFSPGHSITLTTANVAHA